MKAFNGNNINEIASFLDTPEIEKFSINDKGQLLMEYDENVNLVMNVGDLIYLDENNEIKIIRGN